ARRVGGQVAAAVRGADLQAREAVERALEDEVRERDRGLERVADGVIQPAAAGEAAPQLRRGAGMEEDQHPELLSLPPEWMERRVGELLAVDAGAERGAAQAELLHAILELLRREVGKLHGDRGEGDEAVRVLGADL